MLQHLLDESYEQAGEHLRSIFTPERRMSAEETAQLLRGVFVLNVATVTAAREPMVAPVDGLFYRVKQETETIDLLEGTPVELIFAVNLGKITRIHRRKATIAHVSQNGAGLRMRSMGRA